MFRQASSRNHRNKRFKVKHALQMFLLLAVCAWLLYQVKHSHDKKKAFDKSNTKITNSVDASHEILKFGRKDLNQNVEMVSKSENHGEEDETEEEEESKREENEDEEREEKSKHEENEDEEREEKSKHEENEDKEREEESKLEENEDEEREEKSKREENEGKEREEESKQEENEDEEREEESKREENEEERGGGDDEIDEHDQETVVEEADHGEDAADEENEPKEKEGGEEKDERSEDVGSSENQEHNGEGRNSQEAREENYKGDDASSAVVRNNPLIISEVENEGSRNSDEEQVDEISKNRVEDYNKTNRTEDGTLTQSELPVVSRDEETTLGNPFVNVTNNEKGVDVSMSELENESHSNLTTTESHDQMILQNNATADNTQTQKKNETTILDSIQDQNATVKMEASDQEPNSKTVGFEQTERSNGTSIVEGTQRIELEQTENSNSTTLAEESQNIASEQTNNSTATTVSEELEQTGKSNSTVVEESNDNATTNEDADVVQNETLDSSSSFVTQEEKDALTDLETLPHIESEGRDTEDVASE